MLSRLSNIALQLFLSQETHLLVEAWDLPARIER